LVSGRPGARPKDDPAKQAIAARLRKEAALSLKATAMRVHLGTSKSAHARLHRWIRDAAASGSTQSRIRTCHKTHHAMLRPPCLRADVLRWAYCWNSTEAWPDDLTHGQVVTELNTEYSTKGLSANELTGLVHAWQSGAVSRDSMLDIIRRSEVLPEGRTAEEEAKLIESGKVGNGSQGATGRSGGFAKQGGPPPLLIRTQCDS
jgi:hypothetical protein